MNRAGRYVLLFIGLVLVSTAGPFLKCAAMDALAMAFLRLALAASAFGVWGLATGSLQVARKDVARIAMGGTLFATHLALWIWAFDLTNYSSNLLLLVVQPICAVMLGHRLGEKTSPTAWIAVAISFVGLAIIAGGDIALGARPLFGDFVSVLSALAITSFYAVTKAQRKSTPLPAFMALSMGVGAVVLLPIVLLTGARLSGYPTKSWEWLGALVIVTTVGGHGLMNYVARSVTLFTLNVGIILEPAMGIAMGVPLFGAAITGSQVVGGLVLSVAVVIGLLPEWSQSAETGVAEIDGPQ